MVKEYPNDSVQPTTRPDPEQKTRPSRTVLPQDPSTRPASPKAKWAAQISNQVANASVFGGTARPSGSAVNEPALSGLLIFLESVEAKP